jgi:hypothetical protein
MGEVHELPGYCFIFRHVCIFWTEGLSDSMPCYYQKANRTVVGPELLSGHFLSCWIIYWRLLYNPYSPIEKAILTVCLSICTRMLEVRVRIEYYSNERRQKIRLCCHLCYNVLNLPYDWRSIISLGFANPCIIMPIIRSYNCSSSLGMRMPETCWAVFKRQVINLRSCCILLVDSVERALFYLTNIASHFPLLR